jgi:nicotinate-nucleotide adenylyltransferase
LDIFRGVVIIKAVGIFGGTFNPVHIGHLRTALELREVLALDEMRLVPCALPPHRTDPNVTADHRFAMLQIAVAGEEGLVADDCELQRQVTHPDTPSYTIDTLIAVRKQLGDDVKIYLCLGMDSLVSVASWHRWRELLNFAHVIVAARPGWQASQQCEVAQWLVKFGVSSADQITGSAGKIWLTEMTRLSVSSTEIRRDLELGNSVRYLLPDAVIDYIYVHQLYGVL